MAQRSRKIAITFMSGPLDGKTLEWDTPADDSELVLSIGRLKDCDILLDYDSQVSRLHAKVIYNPATPAYYVEDAGSRNGTFIGEDKLSGRAELSPGTLFRVGRTWMRIDPPRVLLEASDKDTDLL
ncbi:MAG: FHA domain-containing protein [Anaerolineae bacterium]|nr:FHA domain-containing protein [Anaerolineae bacterium]